MFRSMRRALQQLSDDECRRILEKATSGVLALSGDDGYPYAVPISFALDGDRIIFHSAVTGHKIDAIRRSEKASFCVIDSDSVIPEKFTTAYRSVIAFGKLRIIDDSNEKRSAIEKLTRKYVPEVSREMMEKEINSGWNALAVLEMRIEHLTGKQGRELLRKDNL